MKKWFNRLLTLGLACSLATAPTVTSLAGGVNGGGSGNSQTGSTIEYISGFHAFQINNGIQCSIVSRETGELVSNIVTMNSYLPTHIDKCPDPLVRKYWNQFAGRTGAFNTKKSHIMFLNGSKTDSWFVRNWSKIGDASGNGGVLYLNHETDAIEQGKMYTYSDIEIVLKVTLDKFYNNSQYAEAYNKAGGSPIDPAGGVYAPTGVSKDFLGPVCLIDGKNTATGDNFKTQMNTELPDGALVLQHFLNLQIPKTDSLGNVVGKEEPLFYFTVPEMQQRYEELSKQEGVNPVIEVMKEFDLKAEFEDIAWMVNEVVCPTAPAGYNRSGLTGENFWNTPYIYYGTPSLVSYQTARDFVTYIQKPESYKRALTPEMKQFLAKAKQEIGRYSVDEIAANLWFSKAVSWFKTNGVGQTWDWSLAYQAFAIERPEPQMGLQTFADVGLDRNTVHTTSGLGLSFWLEHKRDLGYGVMLFSPEKEPEGTSTFDEATYGNSSDAPNYEEGASEDKIEEGGKEQQNNIIKFYAVKNPDGTYDYIENYTRKNTVSPVVLENELPAYKIDSWFSSTEFKEPEKPTDSYEDWKESLSNKESGSGLGTVTLENSDSLYVLLVKEEQQPEIDAGASGLVLHENEISKNFNLLDVTGALHEAIRDYEQVGAPSCPNVYYDGCGDEDSSCSGHSCGDEMNEADAGSYSFNIYNRSVYNTEFVYKWVESNTDYSGAGQGHGGFTVSAVPDMEFTLSRSISDKPTLYPNMNADKSDLNAMGITSEGYTPAGTRNGGAEQPNRKQWNETFTTNWQFENISDPTITFEHCDESESLDQGSSGDTSSMNGAYSQTGNTAVYGLWGKANRGLLVPDDSRYKFTIAGLQFGTNRGHLDKGKTIQFYPFFKMNYETLDRGKTDVYLTSENLSKLLNINRVDTALLRTGAARGLDLSSYQWSTHAKVQRGLSDSGVADRNSVLPAGAIYTLSTGGEKASDCWIGVRLFSSYVSDKGKLASADGIKNLAEVQSSVDGFKSQVSRVLEEYEIVLHGVEGIDINEDNFYENSKQVTGRAGVYQLGGQKLAEDGKYDLKTGGTGANRSDLDIIDSKEEIYDWRLRADADGNITVFRNGELLETISKSSGTIKNTDVYELDQRTKIVSNFMLALDRNLGSDRSGVKWYNEGFEEVGLYEVRMAYKLGFGGAEPVRSAALNIKLSGLLENKSDLYNFSDSSIKEKARTFKFYTSRQSNAAEASGKGNGYIGTYEGQDIIVPSIHGLLQSKLFYTSNGTVTDTN